MSVKQWSEPHTFEVRGHGEFPFDMLRHDQAWPTRIEDAAMLAGREGRDVRLTAAQARYINPKRWESFGWSVIGGFDQFGYPAEI